VTLYDIHNPLPRRRVVFDAKFTMVAIDPGEDRVGVALADAEAQRLLSAKDDLVVTKSVPAAGPQAQPQTVEQQAQPFKPQLGLPKGK
jgi:hypothetical protein